MAEDDASMRRVPLENEPDGRARAQPVSSRPACKLECAVRGLRDFTQRELAATPARGVSRHEREARELLQSCVRHPPRHNERQG